MTINRSFVFLFLLLISFGSAESIWDLIDSYPFSYDSGEIEMSSVSDRISSNFIYFDIIISDVDAGSYTFYVDLEDIGGVISGKLTTYVGSAEVVALGIDCHTLSGKNQFNYSIRIYDADGNLVYSEGDFVSGIYSYEKGFDFLGVGDSSVGVDLIRFDVSLNSGFDCVRNVSLFLEYGNESLFVDGEVVLVEGINSVVLDLDGEVFGATHYVGKFNVVGILIGEVFVPLDLESADYDYEDFVKDSYLSGIRNSVVDSDGDGLWDYFGIDFGINVKTAGTYYVGAYVYDLYGNYLTTVMGEDNLNIGDESVFVRINGSLIYSFGVGGPYVLSFVGLDFNGIGIDSVEDVEIGSNFSYEDFERPALSDLVISFEGNESSVVVRNVGGADAFNIVVDVYGSGYEEEFVVFSLSVGEEKSFGLSHSGNVSLVGLVDYGDLVEEENESNNVVFYSAVSEAEVGESFLRISFLSPNSGYSSEEGEFVFGCAYNGSEEISRVDLYGNFSGVWDLIESRNVDGFCGGVAFNVNLSEGNYVWNCEVVGSFGNSSFYFENYFVKVTEDSSSGSSGSGSSKGKSVKSVYSDLSEGSDEEVGDDLISLSGAIVGDGEDSDGGVFVLIGVSFVLGLWFLFWILFI